MANYKDIIKDYLVNKRKELENKEYTVESTPVCLYCGKPITNDFVHNECKQAYENEVNRYEANATMTCFTCGNRIYDRNYRCPVCYSQNEKGNILPYHIDNMYETFHNEKIVEQNKVGDVIKKDFAKDFPKLNFIAMDKEEFSKVYDELIEEEANCVSNICDASYEINKREKEIKEAEKELAHCNEELSSFGAGDTTTPLILGIIIFLVGLGIMGKFRGLVDGTFNIANLFLLAVPGFGVMCIAQSLVNITEINTKRRVIGAERNKWYTVLNDCKTQIATYEKEREITKKKKEGVFDAAEASTLRIFTDITLSQLDIPVNTTEIITRVQKDVKTSYEAYKHLHTAEIEPICTVINDYKTGKATVEELTTVIYETLSFIPIIERDRFINTIVNTPKNLINIANFEYSARYYYRFKDILTGKATANEIPQIRRFQSSFFNTFDWQDVVNNPKTACKKLKATMPIEATFSSKYESNNGYDVELAQHYLIDTSINTYTDAFYTDKYNKTDLEEYKLYIYTIIADYIGIAVTIQNEEKEAIEERKRDEHRRELNEQREHELTLANIAMEAEERRERAAELDAERARRERETAEYRAKEADAITRRYNEETTRAINDLTKKVNGITSSLEKANNSSGLTPNEKARLKNLHDEWSRMR